MDIICYLWNAKKRSIQVLAFWVTACSMFININVCFQVVELLKINTTSLAVMVVALLDWRLDFCLLTTKQLYFLEAVICKQSLVHCKTKDNRWHVFTLWWSLSLLGLEGLYILFIIVVQQIMKNYKFTLINHVWHGLNLMTYSSLPWHYVCSLNSIVNINYKLRLQNGIWKEFLWLKCAKNLK